MCKNRNEIDKEKLVIEKFRKRQNFNSIVTIVFSFFLPFILIAFYLINHYEIEIPSFIIILIISLLLLLPIINIFARRCPNCSYFFTRYNIFPKQCPRCKIRLK